MVVTSKSSLTTMFEAAPPDLDNSETIGDTLADLIDLSEEELENVALLGLITTKTNDQNIISTKPHLDEEETLDASP